MGFLIGHDFKSENKSEIVLSTSFLSFSTALFTGVVVNLTQFKESFLSGFLIFGIFYILRNYISDFNNEDKSRLIFSLIIGFMIGFGYLFHAILATVIFIYIYYNINIFVNLLSKNIDTEKNINVDDEK
tara:strand:- start:257 stop:643 length:387 start_codon:yes stop_codon:yes gene_type:complete